MSHVHRVVFQRDALRQDGTLTDALRGRILVVVDDGLAEARPDLSDALAACVQRAPDATLVAPPMRVPGGEAAKHGLEPVVTPVLAAIAAHGICRHSTVLVIGGGAVLDAVGFAAGIAHRGVRLIRMPTTTLSQGDAGVGVKNGVNMPGVAGSKNFMGTFAVPDLVVNDPTLLTTLSDAHWRAGLAETLKVALIKDAGLLEEVADAINTLCERDLDVMESLMVRTAQLHLRHITDGGDPFERKVGRPLDFGHWVAHELESRSGFHVTHGDAVAIGMVVDLRIGEAMGITTAGLAQRVASLLEQLGFELYLHDTVDPADLCDGLEHFRQHLGGELTVCMIQQPGSSVDIHEVDRMLATDVLRDVCTPQNT